RGVKFIATITRPGGTFPLSAPTNQELNGTLLRLATNSGSPAIQVQAMSTLERLGSTRHWWGSLDPDRNVKRQGIRLAEQEKVWSPIDDWRLLQATNDSDPQVRLQFALSVGNLSPFFDVPIDILGQLIETDDSWLRAGILSSATRYAWMLFDQV